MTEKWDRSMTPEAYLKRWPAGAYAPLARATLGLPPADGDDVELHRQKLEKEVGRHVTTEEAAGGLTAEEMRAIDVAEAPKGKNVEPVVDKPSGRDLPLPAEATEEKEERELQQEIHSLVQQANAFQVQSDEDYSALGHFLVGLKALADKIEKHHRPNITRWHEGHKAALSDLNRDLKPVQEALVTGKRIGVAWVQAREEERQRQILEEERQRQLAAEAAEVETPDFEDEDMDPWDEPVLLAAPSAPLPAPPKAAGISTVKTPKFELLDIDKADRRFLTWDHGKIRDLVRSLGTDAARVVGEGAIRVYFETGMRVSGGAE
jgi:hypothetical protein